MELTKEMEGTESVHRRMSAPKRRKNRETGRGMKKDENGDPLSLSLVSPCLSPTSLQVHITGTFNKRRRQSHSLHFHQFRLIISRCSLPVPPHHTHIQKHPHSHTAPSLDQISVFIRPPTKNDHNSYYINSNFFII